MTDRVDTRPLRSAAQQQTGRVVAGALSSGAGGGLGPAYLASLSTFGISVGRVDLLIALALSAIGAAAPAAYTAITAVARTVRAGERDTTPWRAACNDLGEPLRPPSADVLRDAVEEVAWSWGYDRPVTRPSAPSGPSGTSVQRAATRGGAPSADPPPDYTGRAVAEFDEGWRDRSSDPQVRRGRDIADRADRYAASVRSGRHGSRG